jgi:hypothetical protein
MRKRWIRIPLAAAVLGLAMGCGGTQTDDGTQTQASSPSGTVARQAAGDAAAPTPTAETAAVSVSGKLGCGHCDFHVKDTCSLAMQTDEGMVYLIEGRTS